ncbi:hypothetical protein D3C87_1375970 [compost metagenome]
MDHYRAGKVMETGTELRQQPGLQTKVAVPDHAFEERVNERHDQRCRAKLRNEPGTLGNTTGDDRRDRRGEGQQKEKLHQSVTVIGIDHRRRLHKGDAVGNPIAYKEVSQRRNRKVAEDFRQCVDLVFLPDRSDFEEGETGVHGQHHDCADEDEQRVGTMDQAVHSALYIFHGFGRPKG